MSRREYNWDDAALLKLRQLHSEGLSFSLIATAFGGAVTRGAVLKRARRLGLRGKPTKTEKMGYAPFSFGRGRKTPPKPPRVILAHPDPIGPLEDIAAGCKFIKDDPGQPGWQMCGHKTIADHSWCEFHASIVFEPRRSAA